MPKNMETSQLQDILVLSNLVNARAIPGRRGENLNNRLQKEMEFPFCKNDLI